MNIVIFFKNFEIIFTIENYVFQTNFGVTLDYCIDQARNDIKDNYELINTKNFSYGFTTFIN